MARPGRGGRHPWRWTPFLTHNALWQWWKILALSPLQAQIFFLSMMPRFNFTTQKCVSRSKLMQRCKATAHLPIQQIPRCCITHQQIQRARAMKNPISKHRPLTPNRHPKNCMLTKLKSSKKKIHSLHCQ